MPYTAEVMEAGEWSVGLKESTPPSVLAAVDLRAHAFSTIVLTRVEVDPEDYSDADFLIASDYLGRYLGHDDNRLLLRGDGIIGWLGDENDGGDLYVGASGTSTALILPQQLSARVFNFGNGLGVTSYDTPFSTRSVAYEPGTSRRQFLDTICALYPGGPWEWRVMTPEPLGGVFVGRRGRLYPTTDHPTVILAPEGGAGATAGTQKYLALDGVGDYAQTPDASRLDVVGDIDIRVRVRADDYTIGSLQTLVSKWNTTGNQRSYRFELTGAGELQLFWSTNGTATLSETSTGASFTDGRDYWLRVTLDVNDGSGNRVATFYYSTDTTNAHDDVSWTQIDSNTTAGTTNIFASTAVARVSGIVGSTLEFAGRVYAGAILDGIAENGAVVASPNFTEWASGSTAQDDDEGNPWALNGNARIFGVESAPVIGLPASLEMPSVDVEDYRTQVVTGDPDTAIVGSASNTPPAGWVDFNGDSPDLRSFVSSRPRANFQDHPRRWSARVGANKYAAWVLNSAAQATTMATRAAAATNSYDLSVTADIDVETVGRYIECGDTVYVWDFELGLADSANEVYYRGEAAHPEKLRVQRMEVPITEGMGVYLRVWDGVSAFDYVNLTQYVEFEEGPARLELGTKARLHRPNTRPRRLPRRRLAAQARLRYRLARWLGGGL